VDGFVASAVASIAAGWSDPVPGWDLHRLLTSAFHGAHETGSIAYRARPGCPWPPPPPLMA
jgi:hypothetical protein